MPTFRPSELVSALSKSFVRAGFRPGEAAIVASHLVDSERKGVFSHGLIRVPYYIQLVKDGQIRVDAEPQVVSVEGAISIIDAQGGLGIAAFELGLDLAIERIAGLGCVATAIVNCGHTGRVGAYVERAANSGYLGIAIGGGGSGTDWSRVVPFGGSKPVMSTNPYAFAMPSREYGAIYADFATSAVAEGKVKVSRVAKQPLPPGSIIDRDGKPSDDPEAFFAGGALLPAAGPKGSGMAIIAELVGCAMLANPKEFNWLLLLVDVKAFGNGDYDAAADNFLKRVKCTPAAEGFAEVLLPGEKETTNYGLSETRGIHVSEEVWSMISPVL